MKGVKEDILLGELEGADISDGSDGQGRTRTGTDMIIEVGRRMVGGAHPTTDYLSTIHTNICEVKLWRTYLQQEQILHIIRRELRKLAPDCRVDLSDIGDLLKNEVLKRNVLEGEEATKAFSQVKRFYNKQARKSKTKGETRPEGEEKPAAELEAESQDNSQE